MEALDKIKFDLLNLKLTDIPLSQVDRIVFNYFEDSDLEEIDRMNGIPIPSGVVVYQNSENNEKNTFVRYADKSRNFIILITNWDLRCISNKISNTHFNGLALKEDKSSSETVPVYRIASIE